MLGNHEPPLPLPSLKSNISFSLTQHHYSPLTHTPVQGYSGGLLYDGQYIANTTSTVVVTVNYRLGAIGFLVYGTGEGALTGNYGLKVFSVVVVLP